MRVSVIFNPVARGGKAKRLEKLFKSFPDSWNWRKTSGPGSARRMAAESVAEGFNTIVAGGGDGTLNEVLNGIADAPDGLSRARLGVLPLGTVNVFARELGIPRSFTRAIQIIRNGRDTTIDLPLMEFRNQHSRERRHFIQMAGAGWDARAIELTDWNLKKRFGQFAYMVSSLRALKEPRPQIRASHNSTLLRGELVICGNGRFYGGAIPVFGDADPRDGLLDVCVFPVINWFVLARYLLGFLIPKLYSRGSETCFQTSNLSLEANERVPIELDGETVGSLPARCSIGTQTIRVVVP